MGRNSDIEPILTPDDIETIGDIALGILDRQADDVATRKKLQRIGSQLSARQVFSDRRKSIFIRTLAQTGVVGRAATAAGWSRGYPHQLRKIDEEFAKLWDQALEFATDALEEEARRRALEGTERPVYQQGRLVGTTREYSDGLLTLLLKAKRPNEFRENASVDVGVKGGVLVVPGVGSASAWEAAAGANQADHRTHQGEPEAEDPLA